MPTETRFYEISKLREAWFEVKRKKAHGGIDGITIENFEQKSDFYLQELSLELVEDRYVPEPYLRFYKHQVESAPRPLGLPTIRDKVVQMAVKMVMEPIFNAEFLDCSYAYRPRKGHRKALNRVEHYLSSGFVWVTSCDIHKFFDSLNHQILLELIKQKIKDERILRLITLWLKIGIVYREEYKEIDKGVPQGGIISPLLSNIYLHNFDVAITQKRYKLVRYADDFIMLTRNRNQANRAYDDAKGYLEDKLKLTLNPVQEKSWHVKGGFIFLGMEFRGYKRTISERKFRKAQSKIKKTIRDGKKRKLLQVIEDLNDSIKSWRFYYGKGNTQQQFRKLEQLMQNELVDLLDQKLELKELDSRGDAKPILHKLEFLLTRKTTDRRWFVNSIIKGKKIQTEIPSMEKSKVEKAEKQINQNEAKKSDIKKDIYHKKKKYQRKLAESVDLIISRPGQVLGKMYQRIVVRKEGKILQQIPYLKLKYIMVISDGVSLSSDVIRFCGNAKIPIDFIDIGGQPTVRLANPSFPQLNVGLAQLEAFKNGKANILAKTFVAAKVRNQLNLMKYFHKYRKDVDKTFHNKFLDEEKRIESYLEELDNFDGDWSLEENRNKLFGIEGRTASSYWELIREMVKNEVEFKKREHQGAKDLFNCLLNYGYGILYSRIWGSVLRAGLNPAISFLHTDQPKKPTLVYDLIEEFRSQCVDRVIVSMINRGEEFRMKNDFLDKPTRRKLSQNILERLNIPIKFRKHEMSLAQIINYQGKSLASFLLGKIATYKPYIGKW